MTKRKKDRHLHKEDQKSSNSRDNPVSLHPLTLEQALAGLMGAKLGKGQDEGKPKDNES